jgi:uncharacterized LabA/DUF88 family protein
MANVCIYIDGFNLYYRALKGTPYLWLDVGALCAAVLPNDKIIGIKYFTAHVSARPGDPGKPIRQQTYFRALKTIPALTIHLGQFKRRSARMPLSNTTPTRLVWVDRTEEKGSDVNLASHLLLDGFRRAYDLPVVLSNDSDLETPVRMVKEELKLPIGIINPDPVRPSMLKGAATFIKRIRQSHVMAAQFPTAMTDASGSFTKPATW